MLGASRLFATAGLGIGALLLIACASNSDPSWADTQRTPGLEQGGDDQADARQRGESPNITRRVSIGSAHWGDTIALSLETLVGSQASIVIGRVIGADIGRVMPLVGEPGGETPPADHPKASAQTPNPNDPSVGIPWTNYSVEVVQVIRAATLRPGDTFTISQEGALIDGIAYEMDGDRVILVGTTQLFFLSEARPGVFVVSPFMRFPLDENGRLLPVDAMWSYLPAVKALTGLTVSGAAAKILVAIAITAGDSAPPLPPQVEVPGVSWERLQEAGITLSPPLAGAAASITEESAVTTGAVLGLTKVRGSVLAQLYYSSSVPNIDRLVWIVSFDTSGSARSGGGGFGPGGVHTEWPVAWSIAVVDAVNGELLFTLEGGLP